MVIKFSLPLNRLNPSNSQNTTLQRKAGHKGTRDGIITRHYFTTTKHQAKTTSAKRNGAFPTFASLNHTNTSPGYLSGPGYKSCAGRSCAFENLCFGAGEVTPPAQGNGKRTLIQNQCLFCRPEHLVTCRVVPLMMLFGSDEQLIKKSTTRPHAQVSNMLIFSNKPEIAKKFMANQNASSA